MLSLSSLRVKEELLWNEFGNLAVYIFWIVASTALILLAYVLSGNQYSPFAVLMVYAGLAGLAIGIFGGFYTIVSNRTVHEETDSEDKT